MAQKIAQKIITNCLGTFVIEKDKILEKKLSNSQSEKAKKQAIVAFQKKYPKAKVAEFFVFPQAKEYLGKFYEQNMQHAKSACKQAVKREHFIMQAVEALRDIERAINPIVKRARDWYALYCPEASEFIEDHETFIKTILTKDREEILEEIEKDQTIGADISNENRKPILEFAKNVKALYKEKERIQEFIEQQMQEVAPNTTAVAGPILGAELIAHRGSLQRLAFAPASTIQLLGAEKALFRFMSGRARCPKHGIIMRHPLVAKARRPGAAARTLAAAISKAAKVDFFGGNQYVGYEIHKKMEERMQEKMNKGMKKGIKKGVEKGMKRMGEEKNGPE